MNLVPNHKRMVLLAGRSHPELATEVAECLGVPLSKTTAYDFANGEIFVRFQESVRGCDAFVLQSHTTPINTWIMEQLIMVDALKRASAKRITVIMPFYGYARQDKKHRGREPISARLMADLFKTAGADRLMTGDLHTSQSQGFFDLPVDQQTGHRQVEDCRHPGDQEQSPNRCLIAQPGDSRHIASQIRHLLNLPEPCPDRQRRGQPLALRARIRIHLDSLSPLPRRAVRRIVTAVCRPARTGEMDSSGRSPCRRCIFRERGPNSDCHCCCCDCHPSRSSGGH